MCDMGMPSYRAGLEEWEAYRALLDTDKYKGLLGHEGAVQEADIMIEEIKKERRSTAGELLVDIMRTKGGPKYRMLTPLEIELLKQDKIDSHEISEKIMLRELEKKGRK